MLHSLSRITTLLLVLSSTIGAAREWQDSSGKFKVEATLVSIKEGKVYLEKADGTVVPVPLAKLAEADLAYLLSLPEYENYFAEHPLPEAPATANAVSRPAFTSDRGNKPGEVRAFPDLGWGVESLAFSPNGRWLAAGKMDRAVMLFDLPTAKRVAFRERLDQLAQVTAAAFTPQGDQLLTGGSRGRIQTWKVSPEGDLTEGERFVGHTGKINVLCVSADGRHVLSGGGDKKVCYWELASCREKFVVDGFSREVQAAYLTRGGKQALATDGDTVALIDVVEGKPIQVMKLGHHSAHAVDIAPDGSKIAISEMYAVRIWEVRSGKELPVLQDNDIQWSVCFTPNSRYLLSGGSGKVSLWEIATQRKLSEFDIAEHSSIKNVACSPDYWHFAAIGSSAGQTLKVFRLPADVAKK